MRPSGPRDSVAGPDSGPEPPYPLRLSGEVIKGFGRGSKEVRNNPPINIIDQSLALRKHGKLTWNFLFCSRGATQKLGIPTANIPSEALEPVESKVGSGGLATGVYYGVVTLDPARFSYVKSIARGETSPEENGKEPTILPAVLSIGYNPFYKNEVKSIVRSTTPLPSPPRPLRRETKRGLKD